MPAHLLSRPPDSFQITLHLEEVHIAWDPAPQTEETIARLERGAMLVLVAGFVLWQLLAVLLNLPSTPLLIALMVLLAIGRKLPGWIIPPLNRLSRWFMPTSLTLQPTRLVMCWRRRETTVQLEDIVSVTGDTDIVLMLRNGETRTLPGTRHLLRHARLWLQDVLSEAARQHRERLTEAGHDLSQEATVPAALRQLPQSTR